VCLPPELGTPPPPWHARWDTIVCGRVERGPNSGGRHTRLWGKGGGGTQFRGVDTLACGGRGWGDSIMGEETHSLAREGMRGPNSGGGTHSLSGERVGDPVQGGGGYTCFPGREWGDPILTTRQKLLYSVPLHCHSTILYLFPFLSQLIQIKFQLN
jgi:hypothetical protein